ncbi:hypothetical protein ONZ43_g6591 [Nemania bipapillata]|uniref:Uncharacterized protein n=1 Tax=Nemania bipapillata TaxID=110536 RepID=A0ACC2HYY9_9PEZI|nr:hypothetical protein ONZ43_g6591 [Nemania bipapillata]
MSPNGPLSVPVLFQAEFPKLKKLYISSGSTILNARSLSCILQEGLSSLCLRYLDSTAQLISQTRQIHTLENIVLYGSEPIPAGFIMSNKQIRAFALLWHHRDADLRNLLRSFRYFPNLRVLLLIWTGPGIPDESLIELSRLSQVEVLHIGAAFFPEEEWFIHYDKIRQYLGDLVNLRRLVLEQDRDWATDLYKDMILDQAISFVQALPKLEYIVIGETAFTIADENGVREPVMLPLDPDSRDYTRELLRDEFGVGDFLKAF